MTLFVPQSRHDSLFSESGKNQTVIRQQSLIDSLELQLRTLHKQLEDLQLERKRDQQNEMILRGELLSLTSQHNTLKTLYESELASLRPLLQEQVIHVRLIFRYFSLLLLCSFGVVLGWRQSKRDDFTIYGY